MKLLLYMVFVIFKPTLLVCMEEYEYGRQNGAALHFKNETIRL